MKHWICPKCGEKMEASEFAIRANCRVCKSDMVLDQTVEETEKGSKRAEKS